MMIVIVGVGYMDLNGIGMFEHFVDKALDDGFDDLALFGHLGFTILIVRSMVVMDLRV